MGVGGAPSSGQGAFSEGPPPGGCSSLTEMHTPGEAGRAGYLDTREEGDLRGSSAQIQHAHTAASWGFQTA